jgi:hypothetical protein
VCLARLSPPPHNRPRRRASTAAARSCWPPCTASFRGCTAYSQCGSPPQCASPTCGRFRSDPQRRWGGQESILCAGLHVSTLCVRLCARALGCACTILVRTPPLYLTPPHVLQVVASCFLLNWRPCDGALLASCGVLEALQAVCSLHALARLYQTAAAAATVAAVSGGVASGLRPWSPWPYNRVCTAVLSGRLSKVEVLAHMHVRAHVLL